MYTHNKTHTNIVHYVDRQNIIKTISKTTSTTSLLTFLLHLFILKLWPADMLFYRTYIMRNFTKMLRSRGVGSRWLLPKTNPQKHARKEKRWILMDIFQENHASGHIRKSRVSPILVGWKHAEAKGHSIPIVRNNHWEDFHRIILHLLRFSSIVNSTTSVIIFLPI